MKTSATFEAATLIDVIQRAAKASPRAGATGKTAGFVIDVQPENQTVIVRATNGDVFFREVIDALILEGNRAIWRVSSQYLSRVIATFKSRSGDEITCYSTEGEELLRVEQGRKLAKLGLMRADEYPSWFDIEPTYASVVSDFGNAIQLVEWAGDPTNSQLGIRLTSTAILATDKYVMARVPITIDTLDKPITMPIGILKGIIDLRGEIRFGVVGGQVLILPNDRTQIRAATVDQPYPNIESAMRKSHEAEFRVDKDELLALIAGAQSIAESSGTSILRLFIGQHQLAGVLEQVDDRTTGIRDIIDVEGADHNIHEIWINPEKLHSAVRSCPDEKITVYYCVSRLEVLKLSCLSGYECWVTPIRPGVGVH